MFPDDCDMHCDYVGPTSDAYGRRSEDTLIDYNP